MGDEKKLPALRSDKADLEQRVDSMSRALEVTDPISGFFHGVRSKALTKALDRGTAETDAFTRNMNAQTGAVRAMVALRNAVDDYRARDELADRHYERARDRAQSQIDQERAGLRKGTAEARREALNAKHGLQATRRNRDKNFRLGDVRKKADIAEVESRLPPSTEEPPTVQVSNDVMGEMKALYARGQQVRVSLLATGDMEKLDKLEKALEGMRAILKAAGEEV